MNIEELKLSRPKPRSSRSDVALRAAIARHREIKAREKPERVLTEILAEAGSVQGACDLMKVSPADFLALLYDAGLVPVQSVVSAGSRPAVLQRRQLRTRQGRKVAKPLRAINVGLAMLDSQSESAQRNRQKLARRAQTKDQPRVRVKLPEPYSSNLDRIARSNNTSRHWVFNYLLATHLHGADGTLWMGQRTQYQQSQSPHTVMVLHSLLTELQERSDGLGFYQAFHDELPKLGALQTELWIRFTPRGSK